MMEIIVHYYSLSEGEWNSTVMQDSSTGPDSGRGYLPADLPRLCGGAAAVVAGKIAY